MKRTHDSPLSNLVYCRRCAVLWLTLLISACQALPGTTTPTSSQSGFNSQLILASTETDWLTMVEQHLAVSPKQAQQLLEQTPTAEDASDELRLILLNQQLQNRDGWIYARDQLRLLLKQDITSEQHAVLELLLRYNQAMINLQHQQSLNQRLQFRSVQQQQDQEKLRQQLQQNQAQIERLQAKIEALTHLEQRLNIRKEQAEEASQP